MSDQADKVDAVAEKEEVKVQGSDTADEVVVDNQKRFTGLKFKVSALTSLVFALLFVILALNLAPFTDSNPLFSEPKSNLLSDRIYMLIFVALGFVLLQLLIMVVLWQPAARIQSINRYLPLLTKASFKDAQLKLKAMLRKTLWRDESDVLIDSVITLVDQFEVIRQEAVKRAQQFEEKSIELEKEKDFVTCLLDTAHALIMTIDCECRIHMVNRHGLSTLGVLEREVIGKRFTDLIAYDEKIPDVRFQLQELIKGNRNEFTHESELMTAGEKPLHMAFFHSRLPERDNSGDFALTVALDISQRKVAEEHLGWLASHDPLTGLFNRRRFKEDLERIIAAAQRYKTSGALLFFDLDQFKDVNDTSGHHVGDDLLKRIARTLKKESREVDIVSRLGGDEFAMILLEANASFAQELAERLCAALNKVQVQGADRVHRASCSIGVAIFPEHGANVEEILGNADMAMYQAKESGRNGWYLFQADDGQWQKVRERVYWNEKVKSVLENESFELYFQPIMNLQTGTALHYEVLLRFFDQGESLAPKKFIQFAEKAGKMLELDRKIVSQVFQYKQLLEVNHIEARLSVNLSGASFRSDKFYHHLKDSIGTFGISAKDIIFEITETVALKDTDKAREIMSDINDLGCRFSLGGFGVGVSSFYHLKQFPFDYVKIDGAFIKDINEDMDDQVMVRALVEVAQSFGQFVIAESVESEEVMELLGDELHVDFAQGNFIATPRPFEQIWEIDNVKEQLDAQSRPASR